jgi:hypothetical protein
VIQNEGEEGWGTIWPTDPQRIADKVARYALSTNPPWHYVDGWLSGLVYCMGCYMPCWMSDLVQAYRLRLPPLFGSLAS